MKRSANFHVVLCLQSPVLRMAVVMSRWYAAFADRHHILDERSRSDHRRHEERFSVSSRQNVSVDQVICLLNQLSRGDHDTSSYVSNNTS